MLANTLDIFSTELRGVIDKVFSTLIGKTFGLIRDGWKIKTTSFTHTFSSIILKRKDLSNQLKYRLSHPQYFDELQHLDNNVEAACDTVQNLIKDIKSEIRKQISDIAEESLNRLEYAVIAFTGLLDGMVLSHNIDVPGNFSIL